MLSFSSIGTWVGLIFFLSAFGSLELLARPELDGRYPKWQSVRRYHQARMHQNAARGIVAQSSIFSPAGHAFARDTDSLDIFSLLRELGRIMQHQNGSLARRKTRARRAEMPGQNVRFADSIVGEKAVSRFGVGPVLAHQRNTLAGITGQLREQCAKSFTQTRVFERAARQLVINPFTDRRPKDHLSRLRFPQRLPLLPHAAPCIGRTRNRSITDPTNNCKYFL